MSEPIRSGFVCLVGQPNVGKSTLLNKLVGRPISITASKPQTTRNRILGVLTTEDYQAVFMDTPGIHKPKDPLNLRMVNYAKQALVDADLILMLIEPLAAPQYNSPPNAELVLQLVKETGSKALLVINKIDRAQEGQVLETIRRMDETGAFTEIVPISALTGKGVERLAALIPDFLEEGPRYFEPDSVTDQSESALVAELIRQEIFRRTEQEVPYSTAVRVESMEEKPRLMSIHARIYVERESQKGILIGKGGRMLKAIGQAARKNIESIFGIQVYLNLRVNVLKDWSENPRHLAELGYPEA
ncbi:MAG: GTPase Era [SAR324 cluster bacterium]|nr:GTPase Era [SAR324 cluster bacterium]